MGYLDGYLSDTHNRAKFRDLFFLAFLAAHTQHTFFCPWTQKYLCMLLSVFHLLNSKRRVIKKKVADTLYALPMSSST